MEYLQQIKYIGDRRVSFPAFLMQVARRAMMKLAGHGKEPVSPPQLDLPGNPASPKGRVLISYISEIYNRRLDDPWVRGHANRERALVITEIFQEMGYAVDVIDCNDTAFKPEREYDILFGHEPSFPLLCKILPNTIKIYYATTLPVRHYNEENYRRFRELKQRRGVRLKISSLKEHNSYNYCDFIFHMGNLGSVKYLINSGVDQRKILHISTGRTNHIENTHNNKGTNVLNTFLYIGSWNPVNRGLDRVLEVFSTLPEYRLIVCTDLFYNAVFAWKFRRELFFTPNIYTMGFVDTGSELFKKIESTSAWQIYPSGSEGAASSVILGMLSGLVPIISEECSIDINNDGWILPDCSIETIREYVVRAAGTPYDTWAEMSKSIKEYSAENFSMESFRRRFKVAMREVTGKL